MATLQGLLYATEDEREDGEDKKQTQKNPKSPHEEYMLQKKRWAVSCHNVVGWAGEGRRESVGDWGWGAK